MGGHTYTGPKPIRRRDPPSEEQFALRHLIDTRGREFVLAFFKTAQVTEDDLARVAAGFSVDDDVMTRIKKVMKESLTHD
jgi:hypothetical protein